MRRINITINLNAICSISSRDIGYIGEHNATELVFDIPQECVEEADCFILNFDSGKRQITSGVITPNTAEDGAWVDGHEIHYILSGRLTAEKYLSITIDGCKYSGTTLTRLFKFPKVEGLRLKPSNCIGDKIVNDCYGFHAQIKRISDILDTLTNGSASVQIYKIGTGVIPRGSDGCLLYCIAGDNNQQSEMVVPSTAQDGTVVWTQLPFEAGQIYIYSGTKWNLIATHNWHEGEDGDTRVVISEHPNYASQEWVREWVLSLFNMFAFDNSNIISVNADNSCVEMRNNTLYCDLDADAVRINTRGRMEVLT